MVGLIIGVVIGLAIGAVFAFLPMKGLPLHKYIILKNKHKKKNYNIQLYFNHEKKVSTLLNKLNILHQLLNKLNSFSFSNSASSSFVIIFISPFGQTVTYLLWHKARFFRGYNVP